MNARPAASALRRAGILAARAVPYGPGSALIARFVVNRAARSLLFSRELRLLERFLGELPGDHPFEPIAARNLAANVLGSWRLIALAVASPPVVARWVKVEGGEHLEQAARRGRGVVVVNSHYGAPRFVTLTLSRLGYDVLSLEAGNLMAKLGLEARHPIRFVNVRKDNQMLLREVYTARKHLEAGGIVHLAGDGYQGRSGSEIAFCGRRRRFASGFADLAVLSGAVPVPAFSRVATGGEITIEFEPPLEPLAASSRSAVVDDLIRRYIARLQHAWTADPGNVRWEHMRRHFDLPYAAGAAPAARPPPHPAPGAGTP
jgi:KDO2-lipid IV(A) lauroyltransferase